MESLQTFGQDIWIVDGPLARDTGLTFTTRMTLIRLAEGSLWAESPVALPLETLLEIQALGEVRYIVSSTQRHTWRLDGWHSLFPRAQLWAPGKTSLNFGGGPTAVNDVFTDTPYRGWSEDLDQLAFRGSPFLKETLFFHEKSGTVISGDIIQANPRLDNTPLRNFAFRMLNAASPEGGVPRDIKLSFVQRARARESLRRLLSWDFSNLIIAHGPCVSHNAKAYVIEAFRWLDE